MKIQGHIAGGWLVARLVANRLTKSTSERRALYFLGALAGTLPDWDYLWYAYKKGRVAYDTDFRHHTWVTHTFPFYWIPCALLHWVARRYGKKQVSNAATVVAASTTAHLLQDTIGTGDGIMLFYPFSRRMDGIGLLGVHGSEWEIRYKKSPIYLVEMTIVALGIATLLYDTIRRRL